MSPRCFERNLDVIPVPGGPPVDPSVSCPITGPILSPSTGPRQARSRHRPLQRGYLSRGTAVHQYLFKTPRKPGWIVIISAQSTRISITSSHPSDRGLISAIKAGRSR